MKARISAALLAAAMATGVVATGFSVTAAKADPRVYFRGKATWTTPSCLMMKATNGRTYQLVGAGPAFPPDTCVLVYAVALGEVGTCVAPIAHVTDFRVQPPGVCGDPIKKKPRKR